MTQTQIRALRALGGAAILLAGSPAVALAEEENKGMRLLLPNMAEFIPACIAFLIIWIIMSKFAWPMVLKMMEEREGKIQGDLDAAEKARTDADAAKAEYQAKLEEADRQADEIIAAAKREAETQRGEMLAQAQIDAQAVIAKAHDVIDAERAKATAELAGQVVDLSVEIAGKIIGDALDEQQQRELAIKYLSEVGSLDED